MRAARPSAKVGGMPTHTLSPAEEILLARFRERLLEAAPAGSVRALVVFGSRARGRSNESSDLDVAVMTRGDVPAIQAASVKAAWLASEELGLHELGLAPVARPEGADTPLDHNIARDGLGVWRAAPP